jgi:hypothetical protein
VRLIVYVFGRPAPQGSKDLGGAGQLLEQSAYLPAWRQAVKRGAYEAYKRAGIEPAALPLFPAGTPVVIEQCTFYVTDEQCRAEGTNEPLGPPDVDKLLRATLDPLGGAKSGGARVFADDAQVKKVRELGKERPAPGGPTGAMIIISDGRD